MIIAHRGASGLCPEHTMAAYELAVEQGADAIELDVVPTRDGKLIVRHENELSVTTDVGNRPEFAARRRVKIADGVQLEGWFTEDFDAAEVRRLHARQRFSFRGQAFDDQFFVPALADVLRWAQGRHTHSGVPLGVLIELKGPAHFASIGLPLEEPLLACLVDAPDVPVWLMSFEFEILENLAASTSADLIPLLDAPSKDRISPEGLREIATYASAIGPSKRLIVPPAPVSPTGLIEDAHAAGLAVFAWTFRNEAQFLLPDYGGDPRLEYERFARLGLDGFLTDFPGAAVKYLNGFHPK